MRPDSGCAILSAMDDVEDQPSVDWLALLGQVRAYAAAHDLLAGEVAARLHAGLTNAPPGVAPAPASPEPAPTERPGCPWFAMSRRQLEELRRFNERRLAVTAPTSDAAAVHAYLERKHAEIRAALERKTVLSAALRELLADAMNWSHLYRAGLNAVSATLGWMRAVIRGMEPLVSKLVPRPFDHVSAVCHALDAALGGNMGPLQQLLPVVDPKAGHPVSSTSADERKALIAGAVAALVLGGEKAGGFKNPTLAGKAMHGLLVEEDFACGEQTPRQHHRALGDIAEKPAAKRSQRETDMLARYQEIVAIAGNRLKTGQWPVEARLTVAAKIAAKVATL
jgi:hypothetical protein